MYGFSGLCVIETRICNDRWCPFISYLYLKIFMDIYYCANFLANYVVQFVYVLFVYIQHNLKITARYKILGEH